MHFLFDYGDSWRFQVEVIGQGEKGAKDTLSESAQSGG